MSINNLPRKIKIPEEIFNRHEELANIISDYLSDQYGFCHYGFDLELHVKNIKWDEED